MYSLAYVPIAISVLVRFDSSTCLVLHLRSLKIINAKGNTYDQDFKEKLATCFCWFVQGKIKAKINTILLYTMKCQTYCIANTVQWLKIPYSYFSYSLCKQPS